MIAYEIRNVELKGKGMIATRNIAKGELILEESPLLELTSDIGPRGIYTAWQGLNSNEQDQYNMLSSSSKHKLSEQERLSLGFDLRAEDNLDRAAHVVTIWNTNCFEDEYGTSIVLAPKSSRINHSCVPNATHSYDAIRKTFAIRAITDINEETEITITFISPLVPRKQRHEQLRCYDFNCSCPACDLQGEYGKTTERRRVRLWDLKDQFRYEPDILAKIYCCKDMLKVLVYEDSMLWYQALRLRDLAKLHESNKDFVEASKCWEKALPLVHICCGEQHKFATESESYMHAARLLAAFES